MLVRSLGPSDLRRDDPFVRAMVGYFERFAAEHGPLAGSIQGYPAGGLAVRCHAGTRALPPGTDPIAERWACSRGIDLARLRAALLRPVEVLPDAS